MSPIQENGVLETELGYTDEMLLFPMTKLIFYIKKLMKRQNSSRY